MSAPRPPFLQHTDPGQTALDPDEAQGLRQAWVATRADLDLAEEAGIARGKRWGERACRRRDVLTQDFLRDLHKRLFGDVWKWAGRYRDSERNIGVAPHAISTELHKLFGDARAWEDFATYPPDECAARLHHRLAWIHPFPNGNGRCARIFADLYLTRRGAIPFTWGMSLPAFRDTYLAAMRAADAHDIRPLLAMVRR